MDITAINLSADAVHAYIEEEKKQEAQDKRKHDEAAKAEREKLHQAFLERDVPQDAMSRIALLVRKAIKMGEKQALLFQFPSDWRSDQGRSITNHAADWHEHLDGFAQQAYAYYERELKPRGFQLRP